VLLLVCVMRMFYATYSRQRCALHIEARCLGLCRLGQERVVEEVLGAEGRKEIDGSRERTSRTWRAWRSRRIGSVTVEASASLDQWQSTRASTMWRARSSVTGEESASLCRAGDSAAALGGGVLGMCVHI